MPRLAQGPDPGAHGRVGAFAPSALPLTILEDARWASFHVYSRDQERVLIELVRPLASRLLAASAIDSFFFVRYSDETGPHVRLRLRLLGDDADSLAETVTRAVQRTLPEAFCEPSPFEPEFARYGGSGLLPFSLDFFALSSAHALRFLSRHGSEPRSRQLSLILEDLVRQALGFARNESELIDMLDWFSERRPGLEALAARGDEAFERSQGSFCQLLHDEVAAFPGAPLGEAGRSLSAELRDAHPVVRHNVGISQMHMTANRLGLRNAEEMYLSQILLRAWREIAAADPAFVEQAREALARDGAGRLRDLLNLHLSPETTP